MCLCYATLLSSPPPLSFLFPFIPFPSLLFALLFFSDILSTFNKQPCPVYFLPLLNMANRSIPKRPVVFTWAEIQKYPTLEARYTETLPFKHHHNWDTCWCGSSELCSCECGCNSCVQRMEQLVKCIKRTGERWAVSIFSELYLWPPSSHVLGMSHGSMFICYRTFLTWYSGSPQPGIWTTNVARDSALLVIFPGRYVKRFWYSLSRRTGPGPGQTDKMCKCQILGAPI